MLNHLVDGMEDAGATVEVINLHKKKIKGNWVKSYAL